MQPLCIAPLNNAQQQQVIDRTDYYLHVAASQFNYRAKKLDIRFDLDGKTAGMYRVFRQQRSIRYNPYIFAKYFEDNYQTTIPHEVAHYVTDMIYGLKNIRPHGHEWKAVMQAFNADSSVTANFDLSGIPLRRQRYHRYYCACREHEISTTRHNRIQKKRGRYYCRYCRQSLRPCTDLPAGV
jgi:SprT protein